MGVDDPPEVFSGSFSKCYWCGGTRINSGPTMGDSCYYKYDKGVPDQFLRLIPYSSRFIPTHTKKTDLEKNKSCKPDEEIDALLE